MASARGIAKTKNKELLFLRKEMYEMRHSQVGNNLAITRYNNTVVSFWCVTVTLKLVL